MNNLDQQTAIEKAIEGGYKGGWHQPDAYVALDAAFWQCLGKAMGKVLRAIKDLDNGTPFSQYEYWWQYQALKFYDLMLTGGDTEAYWADLLK